MNLYGKLEYWAVRQGVVVYADAEHKRAWQSDIQGHAKHYTPATVHRCAPGWLAIARRYQADACRRGGRYDMIRDGFRCHMLYLAVDAAIKAVLVCNGIMFPFARNLNELYGLLPDKSVIEGVDEVCNWNHDIRGNGSDFTRALTRWQNISTAAHEIVQGKRPAVY